MSAQTCPTCGARSPNFCPVDGTQLAIAGICAHDQTVRAHADAAPQATTAPGQATVVPAAASAGALSAALAGDAPALEPEGFHARATRYDLPASDAPPAPAPARAEQPRKRFSTTQWFMKGVADGEAPPDYAYDPAIPEEERRKYSLRDDDDAPASDPPHHEEGQSGPADQE